MASAATQLSLFDAEDASEPSDPFAVKKRPKRSPRSKAAPPALSQTLDLFADVPVADKTALVLPAIAAESAAEPLTESVALPPDPPRPVAAKALPGRLVEPPISLFAFEDEEQNAEDGVGEDEEDASGRIPFDASVWMLRSDRGDFIHIRTGEIREEDGFAFAEAAHETTDLPDEWDLPQ